MLDFIKKYVIVLLIGGILLLVILFVYGREFSPIKNILTRIRLRQNLAANEYRNAPNLPEVVVPSFPDRECNIRDYGAVGDGKTSNTQAIDAAIVDCSQQGGGKVIVPEGKWLTGPINLKSGIDLDLAENAEISFSDNRDEYLPVVLSRYQGMDVYNYSPLIYVHDSANIAITGKGRLIGNGKAWQNWSGSANDSRGRGKLFKMAESSLPVGKRVFGTYDSGLRPAFIEFINSKNILLEDFYIEDGPYWTIHPVYSENVTIRRINVNTYGMNTDGVAVDSSKNVAIRDSLFSTGDDVIAIKSGLEGDGSRVNRPAENILIENCVATMGHSGVAIGSELSGGVKNVVIRNNKFTETDEGLRIKTTRTRGGYVDGVWFEGINMEKLVNGAVVVNAEYESALNGDNIDRTEIRNVFISDIALKDGRDYAVMLHASDKNQLQNFHLKNFKSSAKGGFDIRNAGNLFITNLSMKTKKQPLFEIENSSGIFINQTKCDKKIKECVIFKPGYSSGIVFGKDTDITSARSKIEGGGKSPAVFL